ncbi:MAG: hypothetical protein ACJ8FU_25300, partial [Xanthobacteraceae bacterium]
HASACKGHIVRAGGVAAKSAALLCRLNAGLARPRRAGENHEAMSDRTTSQWNAHRALEPAATLPRYAVEPF